MNIFKGALANMEIGDALRSGGATELSSEFAFLGSHIDLLGRGPVTTPLKVAELVEAQVRLETGMTIPGGLETKALAVDSWVSHGFGQVTAQVNRGLSRVDPGGNGSGSSLVAATPDILADPNLLRNLLVAINTDRSPGSIPSRVILLVRPSVGAGSYEALGQPHSSCSR